MYGLSARISRIEEQLGGPSFRGRLVAIAPMESPIGPVADPGAAPGAIVRSDNGPGLFWDVACTYLYVPAEFAPDPVAGLTWRQREELRPADRVIVEAWDHDREAGVMTLPPADDETDPPTWSEVCSGREFAS